MVYEVSVPWPSLGTSRLEIQFRFVNHVLLAGFGVGLSFISLLTRALHGVGNPWVPRFPTGNGWKWVNFLGNVLGGAVTGGSKGLIIFFNF